MSLALFHVISVSHVNTGVVGFGVLKGSLSCRCLVPEPRWSGLVSCTYGEHIFTA